MENERKMYQDMERIFFTKEQIAEAVKKLGQRITEDYAGKAPVMVCILKGASIFFADLIREIDLPLTIDFMVVSSYGASTKSSGEVRLIKDLDRSILGRDVIIVEDIVDSGLTMNYLVNYLAARSPRSINICALMDKPSRRKTPVEVRYSGMEIPDAYVVGYGLDYAEKYRNLPYIAVLRPEIYGG